MRIQCNKCGRGKNVDDGLPCGICQLDMESKGYAPLVRDTVYLAEYGNCSKARLNEMDRRVILNHNIKEGTYDLGRRGENGKIQEREPDYR